MWNAGITLEMLEERVAEKATRSLDLNVVKVQDEINGIAGAHVYVDVSLKTRAATAQVITRSHRGCEG